MSFAPKDAGSENLRRAAAAKFGGASLVTREFSSGSTEEHTIKLLRELLDLFGIAVDSAAADADFERMAVTNDCRKEHGLVVVRTVFAVTDKTGDTKIYERTENGNADENDRAAYHRLLKLNLYDIFLREFAMPPAPWGILHGVRPVKIADRFIKAGLTSDRIIERFRREYAVSEEKSRLMTDIAFKQQPILQEGDERTVSIYVGIPFCRSRCLYCSFPSYVLPTAPKLAEFTEAFGRDLTAAAQAVRQHGLKVENIYVGGGTPTALPEDLFAKMLAAVTANFAGGALREFTVEAGRPDTVTDAKIAAMKGCGVTRVSVNPQTMNGETLKRIGRQHTPEEIIAMFNALRAAGDFHINMDVILGLPGETATDTAHTMAEIAALKPDSVTLHALTLKRGSRLKSLFIEGESPPLLPTKDETRRMYETALGYTAAMGMEPYYLYRQGYMKGDLDNVGCALPGKMSRYNIKIMAESQTIIGIGGAAATKVVDKRAGRLKAVFNPKDLIIYLRDTDMYIQKRAALLKEIYGNTAPKPQRPVGNYGKRL